jgi:hypothetical protein
MKKISLFLLAILFSMNINAQCPTFSINAPYGTTTGCTPPTVPLQAINTSTFANITYTWIGSVSGNTTGVNINATGPNTYSVYASSPSSTCVAMQTIFITQNTIAPTTTIYPASTKTVICTGAPVTFTAAPSSTSNVAAQWFGPGGTPVTAFTTTPLVLTTGNPGTYTVITTNLINGCSSSNTAVVTSNSVIPHMTINSPFGYTITCSQATLPMSIGLTSSVAPISYTWTNLSTSVSVYPAAGNYTVANPDYYSVTATDGFGCPVTMTVYVAGVCTGINELNAESSINIFPNPSTGKFNVQLADNNKEFEITIFNSIGQEVFKQNIKQERTDVNVSDLSKGIYYYTILQNKKPVKKGKLIIE